jgi:hypothetical protein
MNFDKLIQFKALSQIYRASSNSDVSEMHMANMPSVDKEKLRNVCALISVSLFDRLESSCSLLQITKRQFIEAALIEALDKADKIVQDEGVFESFDAASQFDEVA